MTDLLNSISNSMKTLLPVLVMGDFNARAKAFGDTKDDSFGKILASFADANSLTLLNLLHCAGQPTRHQSVLDLAFSNKPTMFKTMSIEPALISDHQSLHVQLASNSLTQTPAAPSLAQSRWDLRKADWALFKQCLDQSGQDAG